MTVIDFPTPPRLSEQLGLYRYDPLAFVKFAFPWGRPGSALASESGPEPWQCEVLEKLGRSLKQRDAAPDEAVRLAVASGHGIGKSALVAWIILWALSTVSDTRGIVTANTEGQLRTKTWPELAKWHALSVTKDWFTYTATSLHYSAQPGRDKTWRVDAITWSENNTEAIAGLHNKGKRAFALFDEASSIADGVWETIEGALTDAGTDLFWLAFGNPTRTTGRFRECFAGGRFAHRKDDMRKRGLASPDERASRPRRNRMTVWSTPWRARSTPITSGSPKAGGSSRATAAGAHLRPSGGQEGLGRGATLRGEARQPEAELPVMLETASAPAHPPFFQAPLPLGGEAG